MLLKKIYFILLLINCMTFNMLAIPTDHALYISVVKIEHEEGETTAKIHMRVFKDDLSSSLKNEFGYEAIREKATFCKDYEDYINRYFKKQFICTINGATTSFQLSNCEPTEEVYQLTFQMDCPTKWESAQIEATYFMELFPTQSNIVQVADGETKRFGRATKGNERLEVRF